MNPFRLLAPLAALAAASLAAGFDSAAWEFRQTIALDRAGPQRVSLPAETLDAARTDLADLRLLGPDGAEIPFAVVQGDPTRPTTERISTQARVGEHSSVVEFNLAKPQRIQHILLETPVNHFVKGATVEVEDDSSRQWQRVVESALVFRMDGGGTEQLSLDLHGIRARSVRLTLEDEHSATIPITAIVVEVGGNEPEKLTDLPATITAIDQEAGTTRISFDLGLRHRAISELIIDPRERVFQREARLVASAVEDDQLVEIEFAANTVCRVEMPDGRSFARLGLPATGWAPTRKMELVIDNGDSPPLTDIHLVARLHRVDIGFAAPAAGTYTLLAGAPHAAAPRYDVAAFGADWGRLRSVDAAAGPRTANPAYRPAQLPVDVPEFGGPIDASKWRHRRTVALTEPGAQILELDAQAMALSRPDLADLRLIRGDRQVPYLLERTSRVRTVPLALVAAPDAERPTFGRWELALPVAGMPVTSLRLTLNEPVFARTVEVGEVVEDTRGQPQRRPLGNLAVQRRSADDPSVFTIPLYPRPRGGRLYVELDHGDNAAFAPTKAEAVHRVSRLHFRATETAGCELLYGRADSTAPRYDLQLAAPRLLAAPQHTATLEALAGSAGVERSAFNLGGPAARYLFWAALALVVVVLVWLVARLLPKPPAG